MVEKKSVAQMIREIAARCRGVTHHDLGDGYWACFTLKPYYEASGNTMEEALTKLYEGVFRDESRIKHN